MIEKDRKAQSVHARLLEKAKAEGRPFGELLQHYGMEKFLLRMSHSRYAEEFILKGALLLRTIGLNEVRPTRDIDLLGSSSEDIAELEEIVRECCSTKVEEDGLRFDASSVSGTEIREHQAYNGVRIKLTGYLGNARIPMQIDIGFGDAISPGPLWVEYPVLLEGESPRLLVYTLESAIAEKYQAMVYLDIANSRMKDFYDTWYLMNTRNFSSGDLKLAIQETFKRRKTELPKNPPSAFTESFYLDEGKTKQWNAFRNKIADEKIPESLEEIVLGISSFLWPINQSVNDSSLEIMRWEPKDGWVKNQ